jgi:hypothetical protein
MVGLHVPSLRVHLTLYPWYQTSSVALIAWQVSFSLGNSNLPHSGEIVECSVLSGITG